MAMKKFKRTLTTHKLVTGLMIVLFLVAGASLLTAGDKKEKDKEKGYLGVHIEGLDRDGKDEFGVKFGILVTKVEKDSAAAKAGIKKYDVIQYVNGERMRRTGDLTDVIRDAGAGAKVTLKLIRDGSGKTVTTTLGKYEGSEFFFKSSGVKPHVFKFKDKDGMNFKFKDKKGFVFKSGGAYLGVNLQSLNNEDFAAYFGVKKDGGALITDVQKDTPAAKAGLKAGDVITKLDGKKVADPGDVKKILADKEKGDKVDIKVMRKNKQKSLKAELAEGKHYSFGNIFIHPGGKHYSTGLYHSDGKKSWRVPGHGDIDIFINKEIRDKMKKKLKLHKEKLHKHENKLIEELKKKKEKHTKTHTI